VSHERFNIDLTDVGDPLPGANRDAAYRLRRFLKDALRVHGFRAAWPPAVPDSVPRPAESADGEPATRFPGGCSVPATGNEGRDAA
jgi:hypothetical protein